MTIKEILKDLMLDPKYKRVWGIYKITNTINGKIYLGSSKNLEKRIYNHFLELYNNNHGNKHLQGAFNKYHKEAFKSEVLKTFSKGEITERELRNIETTYIKSNKSYDPNIGYNISRVGTGTSSEEFTEERKRKISESNKGKIAYNKGIPMSLEQKLLLSKIDTEKHGKPVLMYDRVGNFIREFDSITNASKFLTKPGHKVIKRDIIHVCTGRRGFCKNYIFRYKNNDLGLNREYFINHYKSNLSNTAPFYILITNIVTGEKKVFLNKEKAESYMGLYYKNKPLQKGFKKLINGNESDEIIIKNKYSMKFIYALSDSDIAKEVRQSGLVPEV